MDISFLKDKGNKCIIFIMLGLLILVVLFPTGSKEPQETVITETIDDELEGRLKNVLSAMEGVGEVEVMITTEGTEGSLFHTENDSSKVCGVVVVAQGAGNATVNTRIFEAVKALFSVDAHKISIVKMRSQEGDR